MTKLSPSTTFISEFPFPFHATHVTNTFLSNIYFSLFYFMFYVLFIYLFLFFNLLTLILSTLSHPFILFILLACLLFLFFYFFYLLFVIIFFSFFLFHPFPCSFLYPYSLLFFYLTTHSPSLILLFMLIQLLTKLHMK